MALPGAEANAVDGGVFPEDTPTADALAELEDQQDTSIPPPIATDLSHQLQTATASGTGQLQETSVAESIKEHQGHPVALLGNEADAADGTELPPQNTVTADALANFKGGQNSSISPSASFNTSPPHCINAAEIHSCAPQGSGQEHMGNHATLEADRAVGIALDASDDADNSRLDTIQHSCQQPAAALFNESRADSIMLYNVMYQPDQQESQPASEALTAVQEQGSPCSYSASDATSETASSEIALDLPNKQQSTEAAMSEQNANRHILSTSEVNVSSPAAAVPSEGLWSSCEHHLVKVLHRDSSSAASAEQSGFYKDNADSLQQDFTKREQAVHIHAASHDERDFTDATTSSKVSITMAKRKDVPKGSPHLMPVQQPVSAISAAQHSAVPSDCASKHTVPATSADDADRQAVGHAAEPDINGQMRLFSVQQETEPSPQNPTTGKGHAKVGIFAAAVLPCHNTLLQLM